MSLVEEILALSKYYAPGLYWFLNLDATICTSLILDFIKNMKHPYIHTIAGKFDPALIIGK